MPLRDGRSYRIQYNDPQGSTHDVGPYYELTGSTGVENHMTELKSSGCTLITFYTRFEDVVYSQPGIEIPEEDLW